LREIYDILSEDALNYPVEIRDEWFDEIKESGKTVSIHVV